MKMQEIEKQLDVLTNEVYRIHAKVDRLTANHLKFLDRHARMQSGVKDMRRKIEVLLQLNGQSNLIDVIDAFDKKD